MDGYGHGAEDLAVQQSGSDWTDIISTLGSVAGQIIAAIRGQPTTTVSGGTRTVTGQPDYTPLFWIGAIILIAIIIFRK